MLNGREKTRPESTCSKMSTSQEKRIYCSSKSKNERLTGLSIMRNSKWKPPFLNKMQNSKREQQKRPFPERPTSSTSWNRWTKRIECRDNIFKKKCTKREPQDWPSWSTRGKLQQTKPKTPLLNCNENEFEFLNLPKSTSIHSATLQELDHFKNK